MKPCPMLPALALACVLVLGACGGGDDDFANLGEEGSSPTKPADADEGPDGMPQLFELSACDTLSAEELDAAGFEPEPSNRAGEAGDSIGNVCWWEGGLGSSDGHGRLRAQRPRSQLAQLLAPRFPQSE